MAKVNFKKQKIPFTQVSNIVLNDPKLSAKSKGLYSYLYSKPDGWDFALDRITKDFKDGRRSIYTAILELEESGYLKRQKIGSGEKKGRTIYHMFAEIDNRQEKPVDEKSKEAKRHLAKIDSISNKEVKVIKSINNKDSKAIALQFSKEIPILLKEFEKVNMACKDFYSNTTQRKYLSKLLETYGEEKVMKVISFLPEMNRVLYNKATTPKELWDKWAKIEAEAQTLKNKKSLNKYQITQIH